MHRVKSFILFFSSIILIAYLFTSCRKGCFVKKDKNKGIIVSEYNFGECFNNFPLSGFIADELVVEDDSTFQLLAIDLRYNFTNRPECKTAVPNAIDFSMHTLLGKYATGQCGVDFIREVTEDVANHRYIYTIKVLECGLCKAARISMNWVLVPKLPQGYTVKFEVE